MNTRDQYTDELVSAYFDGELSGDERARVEQLLTQGGRESQWLEEIESLRQDLQLLPLRRLGSDFTQRTIKAARQSAADAGRPAPSLAPSTAERDANYRWIGWVSGAAILAATLLLAVFLMNDSTEPNPGSSVTKQEGTASESDAVQSSPEKVTSQTPVQVAESSDPQAESGAPDETAKEGSLAGTREPASKTFDEATVPPGETKPMKRGADAPRVVEDDATKRGPATPDVGTVAEDRESAKQPNDAAKPASGQLLMVFDVTLTPVGREEGRFDRALVDQQIPFDATLTVDEELEATLLRSRFLQPAKEPAATPNDEVQLIYVVTRGGKIDEIWQSMRESKKHFSQIKCDLAIIPADLDVFRELRRAAEAEWAARDPNDRNLAGAETPGDRIRAQRLVLPRSWKGVPAHRLGRLGLMPDWMREHLDDPRLSKPRVQPVAPPQPAPGERLGENIIAEALFVITTLADESP
jgi:anti-sigma factor RsiW